MHPTQKPVEVFARPMRNNALSGEICLDPFLGTGTAVIAAEETTRICYGVELAEPYVDLIVKRWEKFTGQRAVLSRGGKLMEGGYAKITAGF